MLDHIDTWVCDLDNTLYPASADLFALIDVRMGQYVQRLLGVDAMEARRIQKQHFHDHGTTLSGLMAEQGIDPYEFLDFVHDIALDRLTPDPALKAALGTLPGRKLVFTNGDAAYAGRVLEALDLDQCFDGIFDIHAAGYTPKPVARVYAAFCDNMQVDPRRAVFLEDMARNLKPAKDLGMATVWIDNGSEQAGDGGGDWIDYRTDCASAWLTKAAGELTQ